MLSVERFQPGLTLQDQRVLRSLSDQLLGQLPHAGDIVRRQVHRPLACHLHQQFHAQRFQFRRVRGVLTIGLGQLQVEAIITLAELGVDYHVRPVGDRLTRVRFLSLHGTGAQRRRGRSPKGKA